MKIISPRVVAALGLAVVFASSASAIPVAPGETHAVPVDTGNDPASVASDLLHPFEFRDSSNTVFLTGNVQARITKLIASGLLTVEPLLRDLVAHAGTPSIVRVDVSGFAGLQTDVTHSGQYKVPQTVTRSGGAGDVLSYTFEAGQLAPPNWSDFLSALTDAKGMDMGGTCSIHAIGPDGVTYQTTLTGLPRAVIVPPNGGSPTIEWLSAVEFKLSFPAETWQPYLIEWSTDTVVWKEVTTIHAFLTPASTTIFPYYLTGDYSTPPKAFFRVSPVVGP